MYQGCKYLYLSSGDMHSMDTCDIGESMLKFASWYMGRNA